MPEADPRPASGPSWRGALWTNLLSFALVAWIAVRHLLIWRAARGARTLALLAVPPWPAYACCLALALGLGGLVVAARLRRIAPEARVYRLLPAAAVLVVSGQVFVAPRYTLPFPADRIITSQLQLLAESLGPGEDGLLPAEPRGVLDAMPLAPPFLVDGQRMAAWRVLARSGCEAPILELPAGIEPGTLLYCTSPDRHQAWLTAVGLGNELAGKPALVRWQGAPAIARVDLDDPNAGLAPAGTVAIE
jgi:hypothetical protein